MERIHKKPAFLQKEKPVLLQGAMELEIAQLRAALIGCRSFQYGTFSFWEGRLGNQPVVLSRTGIGTAAAAAATAVGCVAFQPALVLNQGTAGAYGEDLHPFDLVVGERWFNGNALFQSRYGKDYYLDLEALEGESKESGFTGERPFYHPCDRDAVRWLDQMAGRYTQGQVFLGTIASADQWNDCPDTIRQLETATGALCEEMETAAAGETATRFGVPFGAVRVISNNNRTGEPFDPETARAVQEWIVRAVQSAERD
ncbi:5'-methylthioadenosine/S-adenosylhomocysteine nucleosidase [uncultured Acidaminococcus sp.]|uniref:5'-methylthioadenosine/S-adenosylhomocysteine nucleosidase n=1 Tax=uncultured Acidaminococcus sp. TaxID=352152 RepID=UPI002631046B|nr:5'-methylthioadenosine/S-adenosylhomocysteine nucleosidase [uncultured Acidaminococcus sp.]